MFVHTDKRFGAFSLLTSTYIHNEFPKSYKNNYEMRETNDVERSILLIIITNSLGWSRSPIALYDHTKYSNSGNICYNFIITMYFRGIYQ